jgi:hypothetical protein
VSGPERISQQVQQRESKPASGSRTTAIVAGATQLRPWYPVICGSRLLRVREKSASPVTLVDGHAVPSIFAATPSASTKVRKLMDTLFKRFATKSRQHKVTL